MGCIIQTKTWWIHPILGIMRNNVKLEWYEKFGLVYHNVK